MNKKLFLLQIIWILLISACHQNSDSEKADNGELDFILNEMRLKSLTAYATDPERHENFYKVGSQLLGVKREFESKSNFTPDTLSLLKENYLKNMSDFYSHLSDNETLYQDTIKETLGNLSRGTGKDEIVRTIKFTTILAFLDLQNHLAAKTIYVDDVKFHTKETIIGNHNYVQVIPTVINRTQNVRFIVDSDTIITSKDSLLIPLDKFKNKPVIKLDFMTRTSHFQKVENIK